MLIVHYIETLPTYTKQDFISAQRYKRLKDKGLTWSMIQTRAKLKDVEIKDKKIEENYVQEIIVNVQKKKQNDNQPKVDANSVQYDQQNK